MNIFVLDLSPQISASYHCDQHLHKMILESAQMLSSAAHSYFPILRSKIYKPAYLHHPCTRWVCESIDNMAWVCELALTLESIREDLDYPSHASISVVKLIWDYINESSLSGAHTPFVFAGPGSISLRSSLTIPQKYQLYYQRKHAQWLDKGRGMTYKNRPIPEFMSSLLNKES